MSKKAIITGISGQDGAYLAKYLLELGYKVFGAVRRSSRSAEILPRLKYLRIEKEVELIDFELSELTNITRVIKSTQPDEIYNLGGQSFVGASWEQPLTTTDINAVAVLRILETIREYSAETRFYQASTSEMFGAISPPQSETTPFYPRSPYGVSKLFGHWITKNYRESYGLKACSGILFNHESPIRGQEFVTRKISLSLSRVAQGKQDVIKLGNLSAQRDWGFAGDYVKGMHLMTTSEKISDYVLASGETHSIREFASIAAESLGMDLAWEGEGVNEKGINKKTNKCVISVDPKFFRPAEVDLLLGDASKAENELGWKRTIDFKSLVEMMASSDYDAVKKDNIV
tara:strand:- start:2317 stop:3351 length:1035 start_codon:yes stop_codon:yes gene_type:complete